MKNTLHCMLVLFLTNVMLSKAQSNTLRVAPEIMLPGDTSERAILISSLQNFLLQAQASNEQNKYVPEDEAAETFVLLDELKGIENSTKYKDSFFYKPYLTNVVPQKQGRYLLQLSYIGRYEDTSMLRASFTLIAKATDKGFVFASPLIENTKGWKHCVAGNNLFYYRSRINKKTVEKFRKMASRYDRKLKAEEKMVVFYCCENSTDLQRLAGVDYKVDYNGRLTAAWSAMAANKKVVMLGYNTSSFDKFDEYDLWHDRLSLVIPRSRVNRSVDEGCAYLYAGSWGLSWAEIFKAFKDQVAVDRNADWVAIKEEPVYFRTKAYNNSADYIVNALLVKKIEREKGFAGVWAFLMAGPAEKGNEKYYQTLQKLTGISRADYNRKVWELIDGEG